MTVTTSHPASSYGLPVIIDQAGRVMDYPAGLKAVRSLLGITVAQLADRCGVSPRTIEGWEQGRTTPTAAALNVISDLLAEN